MIIDSVLTSASDETSPAKNKKKRREKQGVTSPRAAGPGWLAGITGRQAYFWSSNQVVFGGGGGEGGS